MSLDPARSHKRKDRWHASELPSRHNGEDTDPGTWLHRNMVVLEEPGESSEEQIEAAQILLEGLSPAQRTAVELCIMQNLPHSAAAEILGVSVNAVDQRLCRARRIMQRNAAKAAAILGLE